MQQPSLIEASRNMIQVILSRGQSPVYFMMNATTAEAIAVEIAEVFQRQRSAIARLWHWIRHRNMHPQLSKLHNLPVMIVGHLPDGGIFLQSVSPMQAPQVQQQAQPSPFVERFAHVPPDVAQNEDGEVRPTLDQLSTNGKGRVTASDILMKAMDQADNLLGVIVIRIHQDNSVDACLNCNEFEAQGVLQKAAMWLHMRGQ